MEMTTRNVRQQSSKNPKPFVYVGPGFPTLFYPRGPKKIRKFPGFVVHKSSLKPHAYLFPSLGGKPAREHQDEVNPNLKKQENNNEGSSEVNSTVSSGQVQVLQILEKVETVETVESVETVEPVETVETVETMETVETGFNITENWDTVNNTNSPIGFGDLIPDLDLDLEQEIIPQGSTEDEAEKSSLEVTSKQ